MEEMGIPVLSVAANPSYFVTAQTIRSKQWIANILFEATLAHLNFTPSEECVEVCFVDKGDIVGLEVFPTVAMLAEQFRPENH